MRPDLRERERAIEQLQRAAIRARHLGSRRQREHRAVATEIAGEFEITECDGGRRTRDQRSGNRSNNSDE